MCPALRAGKIPVLLLLSLIRVGGGGERKARPLGISILGGLVLLEFVIMILIGIANFFVGLAFLVPGTPISWTTLLLNGLL